MKFLATLVSALTILTFPPLLRAQSIRTVALAGHPADGGAHGPLTFTGFTNGSINDSGEAALSGILDDGRSGVWSEGGGLGLSLVALSNDQAPGMPAGTLLSDFTTGGDTAMPLLNNQGQTVFRGRVQNGTGGATFGDDSGLWIAEAGQVPQLLIRENDQAPGAPAGAVFADQSTGFERQFTGMNEAGQVISAKSMKTGSGGVSFNNETGLWISDDSASTALLAREGSVAAGTGGTSYYGQFASTKQMNDQGLVAYKSSLHPFPGQPVNGSGIWLGDTTSTPELLVSTNDLAPGVPGVNFESFSLPTLNNAGDVAFWGYLDSASGITLSNDAGIWGRRGGSSLELIFRESDQAPGLPTGATISFFSSILLNKNGHLAFRGGLGSIPGGGSSGVSSTNDGVIWSEGSGNGLELVAREDEVAPGVLDGAEFDTFFDPVINAQGQVAFSATLRGDNVNSTNNTGVWAQDSDGALQLLLRTGQTIDVDNGPGVDARILTQLHFWSTTGNEDGARSGFNDRGQLGFAAAFSDGSTGFFVSDLVADLLNADFDDDNDVDSTDFVQWEGDFGLNGDSDANEDGDSDGYDFLAWQQQFGNNLGAGSATVATVPEANAIALAMFSSIILFSVRRRSGE